jgi:hypothetical protein
MIRPTIRRGASLNSETLSPNPWDLTLSGQNVALRADYNRDTRTEDRAPQGCDPSAGPSAGMARGGFDSEAAANSTTDPSDRKLIASKNWS